MTTSPTLPPPGSPTVEVDPAHRLDPDGGGDRTWRALALLGGGLVILVVLALLVAGSLVPALMDRGLGTTAGTHDLGTPTSLEVRSRTGDLTVVPDPSATSVTLLLLPEDEDLGPGTPPTAGGREVRGAVDVSGGDEDLTVTVRQPRDRGPAPWGPTRSSQVVLLVPASDAPALTLVTGIGDVRVDGGMPSLHVRSDVGDVEVGQVVVAGPLTVEGDVGDVSVDATRVTGDVTVTSSVGGVDLDLPTAPDPGGTGTAPLGEVRIRTDAGDVDVRAGGTRWEVDATSDIGSVDVDPAVRGGPARLTITTDIGDVLVR